MSLIVRGAHLIDGTGREPLRDATVVVDGDCISAVETESPRPAGDDRVIDLAGRTLIPGLIDSHVHLCWDETTPLPDLTLRVLAAAQDALRNGVTTLRDVGGRDGVPIALRRAIARGHTWGPRLLCAGRAIVMTGGHGWQSGFTVEADGIDGVARAVRAEIRAGADFLKICTTHRAPRPEFTRAELDAIVGEAHRLGRMVACHASTEPGLGMAVAARVDSIEHGSLASDESLAVMARHGIAWVPTLTVMAHGFEAVNPLSGPPLRLADLLRDDADGYEDHRRYFDESAAWLSGAVRRAHAQGVLIGAGTDAPLQNLAYHAVQDEIVLLVEHGLDSMSALLAATANNACILGLSEEIGRIAPGFSADLVVLAGDPLADIAAVRQVEFVLHGGCHVTSEGRVSLARAHNGSQVARLAEVTREV